MTYLSYLGLNVGRGYAGSTCCKDKGRACARLAFRRVTTDQLAQRFGTQIAGTSRCGLVELPNRVHSARVLDSCVILRRNVKTGHRKSCSCDCLASVPSTEALSGTKAKEVQNFGNFCLSIFALRTRHTPFTRPN